MKEIIYTGVNLRVTKFFLNETVFREERFSCLLRYLGHSCMASGTRDNLSPNQLYRAFVCENVHDNS